MLLQTVFVICYFFIRTESLTLTPRIVGGIEASNRSEFSYQASIRRSRGVFPFCGASIIEEKYVLTAAHCVVEENVVVNSSEIKIVTGNLLSYVRSIEKDVETIYVHENFDEDTLSHDIALIRIVDSFAPWTETVNPISLRVDTLTTGVCVVSGWGSTYPGTSSVTLRLMYVEVPIRNWETCYDAYLASDKVPLSESTICAGATGRDSCLADSGGPLVCYGQLTGIVSYDTRCGQENFPGVYTEVASYVGWIESKILTTTTSPPTTPGDGKGFAAARGVSALLCLLAFVTILAIP